MSKEQVLEQLATKSQVDELFCVVLHNDEVHTFDEVIDCLIKYCKHSPEQATQCTYLVHYKGQCEVKTGGVEQLKAPYLALLDYGLDVSLKKA